MTKFQPLVFKRILLTVDFDDSDSTENAFRYAVTQALKFDASLGICSVLENNDINIYDSLTPAKIEERHEKLKAVVTCYANRAKAAGVKDITPIISLGTDIEDEILESIIPGFKPDLLVVGADGNGRHSESSTSVKLVKKSKVSTIVVR